ncbi:MAG: hypothetical protein MUF78_09465 [Candidatus Edwardsbacteria bacterium]|jgi:hypothetical protein|nr:hypothetical protein [Candidatus Edwardsbacteria bacterium]
MGNEIMGRPLRALWSISLVLAVITGCGPRREATETFLCRIDTGRLVPGSITVGADRRHLLWAEADGKRQRAVFDGQAGPWHDGVLAGTLAISADGRRFAYGAGKGKRRFVVLDGIAQKPCDGIREGTPVFGPGGKRAAWGELRGGFWTVVADGRAGWSFDEIWPPLFSPDGVHLAYAARTGPRKFAVLDSLPQRPYDDLLVATLSFEAPGGRLTYAAVDRGKQVQIRDGRPAAQGPAPRPRDRIEPRRVGGVTVGLSVVHDSIPGPVFDQVAGTAYSADSARFAYVARRGPDWHAVVDGRQGKSHPHIFGNSLAFTADGRHFLFASRSVGRSYAVADDRPGRPYHLLFAEDDRPIAADSAGAFHYLALRGDSAFVVEERIR